MSYREYRMRLAWLDLQMEKPSRNDYYIMQLTGHVCHLLDNRVSRWQPGEYQLRFSKRAALDKSVNSKLTKARWDAMASQGLRR